jgi:predicted RNA-binding Zn ribbon-like protein
VIEGNELILPTAGPDPDDRSPAPGGLRLIQALVNTLSGHTLTDLIATPADAASWLAAAGLLPAGATVTNAEQRALSELRESIRAVLAAHTHGVSDPDAADRLTMALMHCRLVVSADPAGAVRLASADQHTFTRAVGAIAIAIAESAAAGTWSRLKSCPGNRCGWAFYDRSPSGRSHWCSMQLCGARAKMRAYRSRRGQRPAGAAPAGSRPAQP